MAIKTYSKIEYDPLEKWLDTVSYSKSGSKATEDNYRRHFSRYLKYIGRTTNKIIEEYEAIEDFKDERKFRNKIADEIQSWIIAMKREGLADSSIRTMVGVAQSFYKYNRINIGFIPTAQDHITYHNRDIRREEIATIMNVSMPRDRAFYSVMTQSGLRPVTICKLRIKHIEYERLLREESPVKIDVPSEIAKGKYHSYLTFISAEAIHNLKSYLKTRDVTNDSFLFVRAGSKNTPMKPVAFSAQFNKTIRKLKEKGSLDFELRANKPSELRLYNLRKFFKKNSYQVGEEFSEFWMGHKGKGVFDNYRAKDPEHHRMLYAEKAMPFLRIQNATPTETNKIMVEQNNKIKSLVKQVEELKQKDQEIQELKVQNKQLFGKFEQLDKILQTLKLMEEKELSEQEPGTIRGIIKRDPLELITEEIQKMKKPAREENNKE